MITPLIGSMTKKDSKTLTKGPLAQIVFNPSSIKIFSDVTNTPLLSWTNEALVLLRSGKTAPISC